MRKVVTVPDPVLRQPCAQVATVDSYILALITELLQILARVNSPNFRAYGLSAPQLGELVQVLVVSTPSIRQIVINPQVTKVYGTHTWVEGCLSLPGQYYRVRRAKLIKFQYLSQDGAIRSAKYHDDYAGIFQHEFDHLSGTMIDTIGQAVSSSAIFA